MPAGEYLAGAGFFLATGTAVLISAAIVVRRRLPHLAGAPRATAFGLVAAAGIVFVHLLPAATGLLDRWAVVAVAVAVLVGATRLAPTGRSSRAPEPVAPASRRAEVAIAVVAVLAVGGWILGWTRANLGKPVISTDALTFDFPMLGRWIQEGTLWQVSDFFPLQSHGSYPHNGDMVSLFTMLPWEDDFLVRFAPYPSFALLVLALYALARELGSSRAAAVTAALACVSVHSVLFAAFWGAAPDTFMLATFAGGALFLVRHWRTQARADLVLAGLGLGLAFGTKWYGPPAVLGLLACWFTASLMSGTRLRTAFGRAGLMGGVAFLAGGFWLIRNWVEYGNPVFPVEVSPLGVTIFDAPPDLQREQTGFALSHYFGDWEIFDVYVLPAWWTTIALGGPLLLLTAAATLWLRGRAALSRDQARRAEALRPAMLAAAALLIAVAYLFTPYTALGFEDAPLNVDANVRYLIPALVLSVPLLAVLATGSSPWRVALQLTALVAVVLGIAKTRIDVPLADHVLAAAILAAIGAAVWRVSRRDGVVRSRPGRALVAAGAAVCLAAAVGIGYRISQLFDDKRDRGDATFAWVNANAPEDTRIGVAGLWELDGSPPTWPMYGPTIDNRVEYVGHFHRHQLRTFDDEDEWRAAARDFDLVLMGRMPTAERSWVQDTGFRAVARSPRFVLYDARD